MLHGAQIDMPAEVEKWVDEAIMDTKFKPYKALNFVCD